MKNWWLWFRYDVLLLLITFFFIGIVIWAIYSLGIWVTLFLLSMIWVAQKILNKIL